MAFADNAGSIKTAGVSAVRVKYIGDDAYYDVGAISDGVIEFSTVQKPDSKKREFPYAIQVTLKYRVKYTSVTNLIKLLHNYFAGPVHFVATMIGEASGNTVSSENIDASTGWFGVTWRLVCEGDFNEERYVEFTFDRTVSAANYLLLLATAPAVGTPDAGDVFYGMGSLVVGDIHPGAITLFEFKETSAGAYTDALTNIRNGSFIAETMGTKDSQGRTRPYCINLTLSAECLQATNVERQLLDNLMAQQTDYKITLADATAVTLDDKLGVTWKFNNGSDMGDSSTITIAGSGAIIPASWTGIWP